MALDHDCCPGEVVMDPKPDGAQLAALLDSVTDAVLTLDASGRLTCVNLAATELLRSRTPADRDAGVRDVLPERTATDLLGAVGGDVAHGAIRAQEWVPTLGGWYEVRAYPSGDHLTIVLRETTERRRAQLRRRVVARLHAVLEPSAGPLGALEAMTRELRAASGFEFAELWVGDDDRASLGLAAADHDDDPDLGVFAVESARRPLRRESAVWRALRSGRPEVVADLADPSCFRRAHPAEVAGLRTGVFLPVDADGVPPSVVGLLSRRSSESTDWPAILAAAHPDLVERVGRQRERHDLARFFALSDDVLVVLGADGRIRRANPRLAELLGRRQDEVTARRLVDFLHPDDVPAMLATVETLGGDSRSRTFHNRIVTVDGEERVLSWSVQPIPGEGLLYAAARDVTVELRDRVLTEAQRDVLRGIVLGEGIERTLDAITRAAEARFPGTRVVVRRLADAATTDAADPRGGVADATGSRGPSSAWSEHVVGADGEVVGSVEIVRPRRHAPDLVERGVLADLARLAGIALVKTRADSELAESEQRLRLLAKVTSDTIWDWDLTTDTMRWRDGFEERFGHDLSERASDGRSWSDHIHHDDRARVLDGLAAALEGGASAWSERYRFVRADGSVAHVSDRGTIVRDRRGRALRMVGGMVDDTHRHELEQQYRRAERLESIGALAGGMAHDLNNVLAPIVLAADLLSFGELNDDQRATVGTIATSARRGADLVRQVLALTRGAAPAATEADRAALFAVVRQTPEDAVAGPLDVEADLDGAITRATPHGVGDGRLVVVADAEASVRTITQLTLEAHDFRVACVSDGAAALALLAGEHEDVAVVLADAGLTSPTGSWLPLALREAVASVPIVVTGGPRPTDAGAPRPQRIARHLPKPFTSDALLGAISDALGEPT